MATYNLFVYCGNNPIVRYDVGGAFWNTIIGTISGAVVGGITAAINKTDIATGIVGGAISGGISGAAIDIAIATGGAGIVLLASVAGISGLGGALGSAANQLVSGTSIDNLNWEAIALDGVFAAAGSLLSFGLADVGGPTCQTFKQIFSQKLKDIGKQFAYDFSTTSIIGMNAWLYSSKLQALNRDKGTVVNYAYRDPYGGGNNLFPRGVLQR